MLSIESKAIASQYDDRTPLTANDRQIIADVLTWDVQREVSSSEIETIAITHDIAWVKSTDNRAIPLHVESFRAIRAAQLEPAEAMDNDIEVDSNGNEPYPTYRVWRGAAILGTFCCLSLDGKWLAFPKYGRARHRSNTALETQAAIVEAWEKAQEVRSTDQGLKPLIAPTPVKSAYSSTPVGRKGAVANWKTFLASGKMLDLTDDLMEKWRELEHHQKAVSNQSQTPVEAA